MILCRVLGTLVSVKKDVTLRPYKMLICHPIGLDRRFLARGEVMAIDHTGAGVGDTVLVAQEGDAAQQVLARTDVPVHSIVVCVVDDFHVDARYAPSAPAASVATPSPTDRS